MMETLTKENVFAHRPRIPHLPVPSYCIARHRYPLRARLGGVEEAIAGIAAAQWNEASPLLLLPPPSTKPPTLPEPKDIFQHLPSELQASCTSQDSKGELLHSQEIAAVLRDRCEVTSRMNTKIGVCVTCLASNSSKGF